MSSTASLDVGQIKAAFGQADKSRGGVIGRDQLARVFQELDNYTWSEEDLAEILDGCPNQGQGQITYGDFIDWVMRDDGGDESDDDGDDMDDNLEHEADLARPNVDLNMKVSRKQVIMICHRMDMEDDEAGDLYDEIVEEMKGNNENADDGVPLREVCEELKIEPEDLEAMKALEAILSDVQDRLSKGQEDEKPSDNRMLNRAIHKVVRELDQARRPAEDAWKFVEDPEVPLCRSERNVLSQTFGSNQDALIAKVRQFDREPPLLNASAGQHACHELCTRKVKEVIERCRAAGTKFTDPEWDVTKDPNAVLYVDKERPGYDCTVGKPAGYKRLTDIVAKASNGAKPLLFKGGIRAGDIVQGQIGTCFLLGAIGAVVSNNDAAIRKAFIKYDIEIGIFGVRFCIDGEWTFVIVDDLMPVDAFGRLLYAKSREPQETWCALLEKAYCKLNTSYEMCDGGLASQAIYSFFGGCSGKLQIKKKHQASPASYFKVLRQARDHGWLLTTTFKKPKGGKKGTTGKCGEEVLPTGLVFGHVYSVLRVVEACGNMMLCLRNPWGQGEWTGKWSDTNAEGEWTEEMIQAVDYRGLNDGRFWMCIEDYVSNTSGAEYSRTFGPHWKKLTQRKHFQKGSMEAVAQWAYTAAGADEISFNAKDIIEVTALAEGWWSGKKVGTDTTGFFPGNYVQLKNRPVARFDLVGTPSTSDVDMTAVVILAQPNSTQARKFNKRRQDGLNYKDLSYPALKLVIVGPDGKVAIQKQGNRREVWHELKLPGGGLWKVYALSVDGLGGDFSLRVNVKDGVASLKEVDGANLDEVNAAIG